MTIDWETIKCISWIFQFCYKTKHDNLYWSTHCIIIDVYMSMLWCQKSENTAVKGLTLHRCKENVNMPLLNSVNNQSDTTFRILFTSQTRVFFSGMLRRLLSTGVSLCLPVCHHYSPIHQTSMTKVSPRHRKVNVNYTDKTFCPMCTNYSKNSY